MDYTQKDLHVVYFPAGVCKWDGSAMASSCMLTSQQTISTNLDDNDMVLLVKAFDERHLVCSETHTPPI